MAIVCYQKTEVISEKKTLNVINLIEIIKNSRISNKYFKTKNIHLIISVKT